MARLCSFGLVFYSVFCLFLAIFVYIFQHMVNKEKETHTKIDEDGIAAAIYGTQHSSIFQISFAYWEIVRSLLNLPLPAVLNIDIFIHLFLSLPAAIKKSGFKVEGINMSVHYRNKPNKTRAGISSCPPTSQWRQLFSCPPTGQWRPFERVY